MDLLGASFGFGRFYEGSGPCRPDRRLCSQQSILVANGGLTVTKGCRLRPAAQSIRGKMPMVQQSYPTSSFHNMRPIAAVCCQGHFILAGNLWPWLLPARKKPAVALLACTPQKGRNTRPKRNRGHQGPQIAPRPVIKMWHRVSLSEHPKNIISKITKSN